MVDIKAIHGKNGLQNPLAEDRIFSFALQASAQTLDTILNDALASLYQKEGKRYMGAQDSANGRVKVAIIGSGNIGSDLMYKLLKQPGHMELVLLTGIDPASDGLALARSLGIRASHEGIKAVLEDPDMRQCWRKWASTQDWICIN